MALIFGLFNPPPHEPKAMKCEKIVGPWVMEFDEIDGPNAMEQEKIYGPKAVKSEKIVGPGVMERFFLKFWNLLENVHQIFEVL